MRNPSDADVLVVGAGIFGLSSAYACARRGRRVVVVDRGEIGSGASGGPVGALAPHLPDQWTAKKGFQLRALLAAEGHWREVARAGGVDPGYARSGRLIPLGDAGARERAVGRIADARARWPATCDWRVIETRDCPDWLAREAAPMGAVLDTLSARIDPPAALKALAAAVTALGGRILTGRAALAVEPGRVRFSDGWVRARAVILAAGCGGFALMRTSLNRDLGQGTRGQAARLSGGMPSDAPIVSCDGVYVVPHGDGSVGLGATSEPSSADLRAAQEDRGTDEALEDLIARARGLCPGLAGARVVARWAGVRPRAPRPDPMLGALPGMPGVFVANGAFRIGFGLAPAVGEALADYADGAQVLLPRGFAVADHLAAASRTEGGRSVPPGLSQDLGPE